MRTRQSAYPVQTPLASCPYATNSPEEPAEQQGWPYPPPTITTITTKAVHKVPLGAKGLIGRGLSALLIGRSSSTYKA